MKESLTLLGNVAAGLGALVCLVAVAFRILRVPELAGLEPINLFIGGLGLMMAASLVKIHCLSIAK